MAHVELANKLLTSPETVFSSLGDDGSSGEVSTEQWTESLSKAMRLNKYTDTDLVGALALMLGIEFKPAEPLCEPTASPQTQSTTAATAAKPVKWQNIKGPPGTYKILKLGTTKAGPGQDLGKLVFQAVNGRVNQRRVTRDQETAGDGRFILDAQDHKWHFRWSKDDKKYDICFWVGPDETERLRIYFMGQVVVGSSTPTAIDGVLDDDDLLGDERDGPGGLIALLVMVGLMFLCLVSGLQTPLRRRIFVGLWCCIAMFGRPFRRFWGGAHVAPDAIARSIIGSGVGRVQPDLENPVNGAARTETEQVELISSTEQMINSLLLDIVKAVEAKMGKQESPEACNMGEFLRKGNGPDEEGDGTGPPGPGPVNPTGNPNVPIQPNLTTDQTVTHTTATLANVASLLQGAVSNIIRTRDAVARLVVGELSETVQATLQKSFPRADTISPEVSIRWGPIFQSAIDQMGLITNYATQEGILFPLDELQKHFIYRLVAPFVVSQLQADLSQSWVKAIADGPHAKLFGMFQLKGLGNRVIQFAITDALASEAVQSGIVAEARRMLNYAASTRQSLPTGPVQLTLQDVQLQKQVEDAAAAAQTQQEAQYAQYIKLAQSSAAASAQAQEEIMKANGFRRVGQDIFLPPAQPPNYPGVPYWLLMMPALGKGAGPKPTTPRPSLRPPTQPPTAVSSPASSVNPSPVVSPRTSISVPSGGVAVNPKPDPLGPVSPVPSAGSRRTSILSEGTSAYVSTRNSSISSSLNNSMIFET